MGVEEGGALREGVSMKGKNGEGTGRGKDGARERE